MKKLFFVSNLLGLFAALPALAVTIYDPTGGGLFVGNVGGNTFFGIISFAIANVLLPLVGIISMLFIIIGGFRYITSQGDEEAASAGKKTLTNAIIGLVIVILSYVIMAVVINALQGRV